LFIVLGDREARMALTCVVVGGHAELARLLDSWSPAEVWHKMCAGELGEAWAGRAAGVELDRVRGLADRSGIRFVIPGDDEWPQQLGRLSSIGPVSGMTGCPAGVWVAGEGHLAGLMERSVAIVGARASTAMGERMAGELAHNVASAGVTVCNAGTFGIDATALRATLAADGAAVVVVGGGLDEVYPRAHEPLFTEIRRRGVIVSERPPAAVLSRHTLMARTRIIAAMAGATVLVEAASRSGVGLVAEWARACGRPVGAIPGDPLRPTSVLPNTLIRDGKAELIMSAEQALDLLPVHAG